MFGVICRQVKEFELMDNREEIINEILELTNELTVEEVRTFIKMFEESKNQSVPTLHAFCARLALVISRCGSWSLAHKTFPATVRKLLPLPW